MKDIVSNCMVLGDKRKHLACILTLRTVLDAANLPTDQVNQGCLMNTQNTIILERAFHLNVDNQSEVDVSVILSEVLFAQSSEAIQKRQPLSLILLNEAPVYCWWFLSPPKKHR